MSQHDVDVIVIGAGPAGLVAARNMSAAGLNVRVLEARDRLGGRMFTGPFKGTGEQIEFGAGWIAPDYQPFMRTEIERYGLRVEECDAGASQLNRLGGRVFSGMLPVPTENIVDLERAVVECLIASRRIQYGRPWGEQGLDDLDVSWLEFVKGIDLPSAVEEYLLTWTSASLPAETSALNILVLFTCFGNSAWAAYSSMEHRFVDGMKSFIDAVADDCGADIRTDSPVRRIEHDNDGVAVTTAGGDRHRARFALVTTPVNTWTDLDMVPALGGHKSAAAGAGHVGLGTKHWFTLRGAPEGGTFGFGKGEGVNWLMRHRHLADRDMYIAFNPDGSILPGDCERLQAAVRVWLRDVDVIECDGHDWANDEYAKGVWGVFRPGHFINNHDALSEKEGARVYFAGGDVSFGNQLWIEGALETAVPTAAEIVEAAS